MTFEQKKLGPLPDGQQKMCADNYAPPLLRILLWLGIRLPPLPFMPFWQVTVLTGAYGAFPGMCNVVYLLGPSGMVAGEAIIISITGGLSGLCGLFPLVAQES